MAKDLGILSFFELKDHLFLSLNNINDPFFTYTYTHIYHSDHHNNSNNQTMNKRKYQKINKKT